jgi:hypothetical protein
VFRALNIAESVLAVAILVLALVGHAPARVLVALVVVIVLLAGQLALIRPALNRRSDRVLATGDASERSHAHLAYVGVEGLKVVALVVLGILALAG